MKTIINIKSLVIAILLLYAVNSNATPQVNYSPDGYTGSLIIAPVDCDVEGWNHYVDIVIPTNKLVKYTLITHTYDYVEISSSNQYEWLDYPDTIVNTIVSTDGLLYLYCADNGYGLPNSTVLEFSFEVDFPAQLTSSNAYIPGNLGVGTNTPLERLHINGSIRGNASNGALRINTNDGYLDLGAMNSLFAHIYTDRSKIITNAPVWSMYGEFSAYQSNDLKLQTNGTTRMSISSANGNVGIGTSSPSARLDVAGSANFGTNSKIKIMDFPGQGSWIDIPIVTGKASGIGSGGPGAAAWIAYAGSNGQWFTNSLSGDICYRNQTGKLLFGNTWQNAAMAISQNKVGIGTITPTEKLTIAGGHNDTRIRLFSTGNGSNMPSNLSLWASEPGLTYQGAGIGYNVNGSPNDGRIDNTQGSSFVRFLPGETRFQFQNTSGVNVIAFTLKETGKVGIGTTNPDEMLTVKGKLHAEEVIIDLSVPAADFVFSPDYQLMPLKRVESFVKINRHLPEIPSASEIKEKGLNMGEMQNKLLQKIEELTLYIIEQQKQIDELQQKIK